MSDAEGKNNSVRPKPQDDEICLVDLLIVLAKRKKAILKITAGATILSAIVALLLPNIYTGRAVVMPPQQGQSSASILLGQLGGIAGGLVGPSLGLKTPNDLYVGMLKSRTVADALVQRFKLQEIYAADTMTEARDVLERKTVITAGKDGLIVIEYDDKDAARAAVIANAYVEELGRLTQLLALSEASKRRMFFEKELEREKENLSAAEVELKKTQEATGLIKLDDQSKAIIEAVAALKAQVAAKEVQLATLRSFTTERNPDYIRAQHELAGLMVQLAKSERDNQLGHGDILVPTRRIPEVGLEYVRKFRNVKYHETVFDLMAKQFEMAKIDESRDASVMQVVDNAIVPEKRSKPKRSLIVILSALAAFLLAVIWTLIRDGLSRTRQEPELEGRMRELRQACRWRDRPKRLI